MLSRLEELPAPGSPPSVAGWSPAASGTGRGGVLQADTENRELGPIKHSSILQGADPTSLAAGEGKHWLTTSAKNALSKVFGEAAPGHLYRASSKNSAMK